MSSDVISDISLFNSHTSNMIEYINNIVKVIDEIRAEGYEMYSVVIEKKDEYQQKAMEVNEQIQEVKRYCSKDSCNQLDDLNKQINQYENRYNDFGKSQRQLEDIAQQCTQMRKTVEVLNENVKNSNRAFTNAMEYYKNAK